MYPDRFYCDTGNSRDHHAALIDKKEIGVLCSWFSLVRGSVRVFHICDETDKQGSVHSYYIHFLLPVYNYKQLCTMCH